LVGVVGVCGGVAAGLLVVPVPVPDVVSVEVGAERVVVEPREFDDARNVPATPVMTDRREYSVQGSGVVRRVDCVPGEAVGSGFSLMTVDDRVVVALRLASPPWRSLAMGMRGADVRDFQKELTRLGYEVEVDGFFSWAMVGPVKEFWASVRVKDFGELPLDRVVWLDSKQVTPMECPVEVGDRIEPGTVVFSTGGQLESVVLELPEGLQPGERMAVTYDGGPEAVIGAEGVLEDAGFLEAFTERRDYRMWLEDPASGITVATHLAQPLRVVPVPAAALYGVVGSQGCVDDAAGPVRVEIVASQLGQTYVVGDPMPSEVSVPAPVGVGSCG
jgi:peptidoglycan hydrolase-like protein with peptidoglycan-binding domain